MGAVFALGDLLTIRECKNKPIKALKIKDFLVRVGEKDTIAAPFEPFAPLRATALTRLAVDYTNEPTTRQRRAV